MAKALRHIDITNRPELVQLVTEVQESSTPAVLHQQGRDLAVIRPIKRTVQRAQRRRPITADDPLWRLVGAGASAEPTDIATKKHEYLADASADLH